MFIFDELASSRSFPTPQSTGHPNKADADWITKRELKSFAFHIIRHPAPVFLFIFLVCPIFPSSSHILFHSSPSHLSLIHPSILPSLALLSTVVALVTIQRDFLHSAVTVATVGFPPGIFFFFFWGGTRIAFRSTPACCWWPLCGQGRGLPLLSTTASEKMQTLQPWLVHSCRRVS